MTQLRNGGSIVAQALYIIHVVIDDLGYNDLDLTKSSTHTPVIEELHEKGVEIPKFYTFKDCAPSRSALMSGRYPWRVGYSKTNGGINIGLPLYFELLPAYLKRLQPNRWATHGVGKWHLGWTFRKYTPAFRGFDTFLGSDGNFGDHWNHTLDMESQKLCTRQFEGALCSIAHMFAENKTIFPATDVFGQYSSDVVTHRALSIIENHPAEKNMYLYLAYHGVHSPMNAPKDVVDMFTNDSSDFRRVYKAMTWKVDNSIGQIKNALRESNLLPRSIFIIHSDNGGPRDGSDNWPLRGHKFSFWEGGIRSRAIISNPEGNLIPQKMWGSVLEDGLAHISDWYFTIAHGIAGAEWPTSPEQETPATKYPHDSINLWPWIVGDVTTSPRNLIIHSPLSDQTGRVNDDNMGVNIGFAGSLRWNQWKIIAGDPGDDDWWEMQGPLPEPALFGLESEGRCSVTHEGHVRCGPRAWIRSGVMDATKHSGLNCQIGRGGPCLFDLDADPSETTNVASSYPGLGSQMLERLRKYASEEHPKAYIIDPENASMLTTRKNQICTTMTSEQTFLPVDWADQAP
eukprot:TRINITY_DN22731_c0_g1_i1.p1 TRINITY_DN22731_c0_g1~~TRINITY_DN22731_c0_g1_i1.p1  ORF type:complete len:585 (+),score=60.07 TRINITY_DN22731_c0_g1_i1:47-1756(+)